MWMLRYYCCDDIPLVAAGDAAVEIDHDHDYDETAADDDGTADYSEQSNPWQEGYHDSDMELDPWHWDSD